MGTFRDYLTAKGYSERFGRWASIAAMTAFVVVLAIAAAGLARCSLNRQRAAQANLSTSQSDAFTDSASDAIATLRGATARETASEELSRSNEKDIRNAKGADASVDPAVRDAGRRSLCRRPSYRDSPECRVQRAAP